MPYSLGESVIVAGRGPGVVTDIIGGPRGPMYRVTLTADPKAYRAFTSYCTVEEEEITAAAALPTYVIGDKVLYQRRPAEVVAVAGDGSVEILVEPPLPDPDIEVEGPCRVALPAWKVYLQQVKP
jgi:hypothetical protein